jgi:hypothetical protein
MARITVTEQGDGFQVEVQDGRRATTHHVTVPATLPASLGWGTARTADLVHASFEFLLEREPATSILRRFSLAMISEYFPEYPAVMAQRVETDR